MMYRNINDNTIWNKKEMGTLMEDEKKSGINFEYENFEEWLKDKLEMDFEEINDRFDGTTKCLKGLDLPIMVNSIVVEGEYIPSEVSEMHIGEYHGKKVLLITPNCISI